MKTPKATKLPSGSWFCRVRVNGQDIPITMPTEAQAVAEAMAIKSGLREAKKKPAALSLENACLGYCSARANVLSPSTLRGYKTIIRTRFQTLMPVDIHKITDKMWQEAVSFEARQVSAKTVQNAFAFVVSVLSSNGVPAPTVRLPQIVRNDRPFLQPEQIPIFLEAIQDQPVELAALLGLHSLRRSEIVGQKLSDIDTTANVIHVRGAAVMGDDGTLHQRSNNKNRTSRRDVPILIPRLAELADARRATGAEYAVDLHINTLYDSVNRLCRRAGLPEIGVHGLRHSFASLCYHLGVSEKTTMQFGGWADYGTMRKIYTHLSDADLTAQVQGLRDFFREPRKENDNGNGNTVQETP